MIQFLRIRTNTNDDVGQANVVFQVDSRHIPEKDVNTHSYTFVKQQFALTENRKWAVPCR